MAKPGPAPGSGGRPRKPASQMARRPDGRINVTTGPKGAGHRALAHRVTALGENPPKSSSYAKTGLVLHKNGDHTDNRKSNLEVGSASKNNLGKNRRTRK